MYPHFSFLTLHGPLASPCHFISSSSLSSSFFFFIFSLPPFCLYNPLSPVIVTPILTGATPPPGAWVIYHGPQPLEKTDSPSPGSHQLSVNSIPSPSSILVGILVNGHRLRRQPRQQNACQKSLRTWARGPGPVWKSQTQWYTLLNPSIREAATGKSVGLAGQSAYSTQDFQASERLCRLRAPKEFTSSHAHHTSEATHTWIYIHIECMQAIKN